YRLVRDHPGSDEIREANGNGLLELRSVVDRWPWLGRPRRSDRLRVSRALSGNAVAPAAVVQRRWRLEEQLGQRDVRVLTHERVRRSDGENRGGGGAGADAARVLRVPAVDDDDSAARSVG